MHQAGRWRGEAYISACSGCRKDQRAGDRTRTGDVQLGKLAFYQLNYARDNDTTYWCSERFQSRLRDLNPGPPDYESGALPLS
jgi:hypothetical protein